MLIEQLSSSLPWLSYLAVVSALLYVGLEWKHNVLMAKCLVVLTALLMASAWLLIDEPLQLFLEGVGLGAFFMTFF